MVDAAEYTGRTVEDAIGAAEAALGAPREQLGIEVVSQGSRGVFGIGAEQARVRAWRMAPPPSPPAPEPPVVPHEPELEEAAPVATADPAPIERDAVPQDDEEDVPSQAKETNLPEDGKLVLEELLASMGIHAEVSIRQREDPVVLGITGRNLGVLIGRRGDNLSALQFMVNLILSKNRRQWPRVVIDVENYRARREESLRTLADRIAYRVRRSGRPYTLEAMPAGDRRIIHLALRDRNDIETYSIGEGPSRRVVIAPKHAR